MLNKKILSLSVVLFLAIELILGILMFRPNLGDASRALRFGSVLLACAFCALFFERSWDYVLTQIAFVLAICADGFLVLPSPPIQLPGVFLFTASYLTYAALLYISEPRPAYRKLHLVLRIAIPCAALVATVLVLGEGCDTLALASVFCFANLGLNVIFAAHQFRRQAVLAVGFLLLFISDMILGLSFITPYIPMSTRSVPYRMVHSGFDFIWAFYLPAQVLLAFSLFAKRWNAARPACRKAPSEPDSEPAQTR